MAVPVALVGVDAPVCQVVQQTLAASLHVFPQAASVCVSHAVPGTATRQVCVCCSCVGPRWLLVQCRGVVLSAVCNSRVAVLSLRASQQLQKHARSTLVVPGLEGGSGVAGVWHVWWDCVHGSSLCVSMLFGRQPYIDCCR